MFPSLIEKSSQAQKTMLLRTQALALGSWLSCVPWLYKDERLSLCLPASSGFTSGWDVDFDCPGQMAGNRVLRISQHEIPQGL